MFLVNFQSVKTLLRTNDTVVQYLCLKNIKRKEKKEFYQMLIYVNLKFDGGWGGRIDL